MQEATDRFVRITRKDGTFDTVQQVLSNLSDTVCTPSLYAHEALDEKEQEEATVKHLAVLLRSGFHPDFMEKEDQKRMRKAYGKKWREVFGYGTDATTETVPTVST